MMINALFCVATDIEILTDRGFLKYDQVKVGDSTIGFNPSTRKNEWTKITNISFISDAPTVRLGNSRWGIRTTRNHRWLTKQKTVYPETYKNEEFRTMEEFNYQTYIVASEPFYGRGLDITNDEAEIIGWVLGDGSVLRNPSVCESFSLRIYQAKPDKVKHLDDILFNMPCKRIISKKKEKFISRKDREYGKFYSNYECYTWYFSTEFSMDLWNRAGLDLDKSKNLFEFMTRMNRGQLESFMKGIWLAEGSKIKNTLTIYQSPGSIADIIELGIYLLGRKPSKSVSIRPKQIINVYKYTLPRIRAKLLNISDPKIEDVWCPTTDLGTWTAKNSNSIFLTGNSNTNYDENVDERTKAIDDLEEKCNEAIEVIYNGKSAREAEISDDNPFMAASKRSLEESGVPDLDVFLSEDEKDEGLKGDLDDFEFEVDRA
jgi:hypothetical protein